jgi:hypothetical protein
MTKLALARKDFSGAIVWGKSVLEVADSMEAKALIANAELASGDMTGFKDWKDKIVDQYRSEDRKFEALHRGGPLHARPEDRMFATFCAENRMPLREAMVAAKRDLANRPDEQARENLAVLRQLSKAR